MPSRSFATRTSRSLVLGVVLASMLGGCNTTEPDPHMRALLEFTRRHSQWTQQNLGDYVFDYEVQAFARFSPVRIEVLNGVVYRVTDRATSQVLPNPPTYPTVDTLFETAAQVLENEMYDARIEYDDHWGVPTLIDARSPLPDAGYTVIVKNFTSLRFSVNATR